MEWHVTQQRVKLTSYTSFFNLLNQIYSLSTTARILVKEEFLREYLGQWELIFILAEGRAGHNVALALMEIKLDRRNNNRNIPDEIIVELDEKV